MKIGARSSPLSRAQVEEVLSFFPKFPVEMIWVETMGDRDKKTSLRTLGKTDFFTRELDELLLGGKIDAAVHSAKDLPDPLPRGLKLAFLSPGLDPRDCLVLRQGEHLRPNMLIATSSKRREEAACALCPTARFIDLRGTIQERLEKIITHQVDGVVLAECALIRLKLTHLNRIFLPGDIAPLQGKLAIVTREDNENPLFRA